MPPRDRFRRSADAVARPPLPLTTGGDSSSLPGRKEKEEEEEACSCLHQRRATAALNAAKRKQDGDTVRRRRDDGGKRHPHAQCNRRCPFRRLPGDCLVEVALFLPLADVKALALASKVVWGTLYSGRGSRNFWDDMAACRLHSRPSLARMPTSHGVCCSFTWYRHLFHTKAEKLACVDAAIAAAHGNIRHLRQESRWAAARVDEQLSHQRWSLRGYATAVGVAAGIAVAWTSWLPQVLMICDEMMLSFLMHGLDLWDSVGPTDAVIIGGLCIELLRRVRFSDAGSGVSRRTVTRGVTPTITLAGLLVLCVASCSCRLAFKQGSLTSRSLPLHADFSAVPCASSVPPPTCGAGRSGVTPEAAAAFDVCRTSDERANQTFPTCRWRPYAPAAIASRETRDSASWPGWIMVGRVRLIVTKVATALLNAAGTAIAIFAPPAGVAFLATKITGSRSRAAALAASIVWSGTPRSFSTAAAAVTALARIVLCNALVTVGLYLGLCWGVADMGVLMVKAKLLTNAQRQFRAETLSHATSLQAAQTELQHLTRKRRVIAASRAP